MNNLKILITIFIVITGLSTTAQYLKETCSTKGTVLGYDFTKCGMCGGWKVNLESHEEGEFIRVEPNEHFEAIGISKDSIPQEQQWELNPPIKIKFDFKVNDSNHWNHMIATCAKLDK